MNMLPSIRRHIAAKDGAITCRRWYNAATDVWSFSQGITCVLFQIMYNINCFCILLISYLCAHNFLCLYLCAMLI